MFRNSVSWFAVMLLAASASLAQVVSPVEIKDPELRSLQQQYMDELRSTGQDILAEHFDYPFYLSRKLDLDEAEQQRADQRSIRFDHYNGRTVVAITGNYYAAYSAEKVNEDQRARSTFVNVVLPILKAVVPRFQANRDIQGYAVEVSHHILGKVMSVSMEQPENLMVFLPQNAAIKLVAAKDKTAQQAALLEGQVFLNAAPITIWLSGEGPRLATAEEGSAHGRGSPESVGAEIVQGSNAGERSPSPASLSPKPVSPPPAPPRDTSPQALSALQTSNQELIAKLVGELNPQAHFVAYAAQSFVAFRQGIYLELSMNTSLPESASGSRYKLAAMAFDDHVAHLVRPALAYFKEDPQFDGISFSTTVHLAAKTASSNSSEAVEFFFPFSALRCYEKYDCTGQQLIDAGTVLINGERVALDLQIAEGSSNR